MRSWLILRPNRDLTCVPPVLSGILDRERPVAVPQSKPFDSRKILSAFGRDSSPETSFDRSGSVSGNLDESIALSSLKDLIAAGDHRLDPILGTITDSARQLPGPLGPPLAMWKEGRSVCRPRSRPTPPPPRPHFKSLTLTSPDSSPP